MKKIFISIAFAFVTLLVGIAVTEVSVHDAKNISQQDTKNAKQATLEVFDEAINRSLLVKLVVREKRQDELYLDAYSLFRMKFAEAKVVLDPQTGQLEIGGVYPPNSNLYQKDLPKLWV